MIHSLHQIITSRSFLPESMILSGGRSDQPVPIVFSFFYLKTDRRRILVDTSCFTMPGMELENPIPLTRHFFRTACIRKTSQTL